MSPKHVAIVGGGAAGLTAAISAIRCGADVTILEAGPRVGRKILATGNGRCNLSNTELELAGPQAFNAPEFVAPLLGAYPFSQVMGFFEELGLLTYTDAEGRIYPTSNSANSVLDVLRGECAHLGVTELCDFEVVAAAPAAGGTGYSLADSSGRTVAADAIVLSVGGGVAPLRGLGHSSTPFEPVLVPLRTELDPIRGLSGIRVRCEASVLIDDNPVARERGELLFRDYGVSGVMVFDLSRFAYSGSVLSIDFFPEYTPDDIATLLRERAVSLGWRAPSDFLDGMLHPRIGVAIMRAAGVGQASNSENLPLKKIADLLKAFPLKVLGPGDPKQAQVTRGGVVLSEVDPETLESRLAPGVFLAGECLDVDGRCGGFNLHWAWVSGLASGENAAKCAGRKSHPGGANWPSDTGVTANTVG